MVLLFIAFMGNTADPLKPYCNWSATQTAIDEFNKHIWEDNCERYVNWLTWDQSNQITGSHCSLEEYQAMLTNPDWVSERAAEQASGTWINQSLDMFLHFAKLTALGATNELLSAVYETLVTRTNPTQPILDRSGFSDITPSTWKTYRGYLIKNQVTYGKLGVSNLNQSRTVYTPGPEPGEVYTNVYYADIDFLSTTEFHQDPPSGSCFSGNTHVVLPDGVSTKRIDELQPGDLVLSPSAENPHGTKQCLFISRPKRGGRKLYSFVNEGTAVFTATHPFHLGFDSHNFPVLGFVDPVAAVAVNPLWAAFSMKKMPDEDIVQVIPSPGPENDTLYDIIFQSSDKLPSNYVIAGAKGSQVRVCSDAPNPATLPSVARFVASLVRSIAATSGADNLPIDCLNLHKLDIRRRICEIRWDCVQKTSAMSGKSGISFLH